MAVDDDPCALECLSVLLRRQFPACTIETFQKPADALRRLEAESFAVVLTDFRMPEMNGIMLLQRARQNGSDASFIVMTGEATDQILTEGLRLGMFALLNKPLSRAALLPLLHQAIECHRLRREIADLRRTLRESGGGLGEWLHSVTLIANDGSQALLPY